MRRSVAILLALMFSWILILPAFAGSAESNLRACCRKDGKHHCMMHTESSSAYVLLWWPSTRSARTSTFHRRNSRGNVYAGPQSGSLCRHSPARHPPSANGSWLSCFSSSIQTEARTSIFPPFLKTLLALRRQSLPYEGGALW
jgi:hypothetical protein